MFENSAIELSSAALQYNLRFIRRKLNRDVRFCSVVKGNAYGHGLDVFVPLAMKAGIDYFAVHSADEAYRLKKSLPKLPDLFIMSAVEGDAIEWAIKNKIEFAVFDLHRLKRVAILAEKLGKAAKVHLEVETGMHRTGFEIKVIPELASWLKRNRNRITLQGLFTHLAGAESIANQFRIKDQIEKFNSVHDHFKKEDLNPVYHHIACSAGLLNYPETQGNMVRIGILQYGFWPNNETHIRLCGKSKTNPQLLKRIIRWTTRVMSVKEVAKGQFVGYGTTYLAHENMKLAILPVGYSHGYNRNLSNVGSVLVKGKVAPVVGTVNMNSLTVDITHCGNVTQGDEVVLIGSQNGNHISVSSFSEQTHQLNYELLTRLPAGIPRVIVK